MLQGTWVTAKGPLLMPKYSAYIESGRTVYLYKDAYTEDYEACLFDAARLLIESDE